MRALVIAALVVAPSAVAAPAPKVASARAFLQTIYQHYRKGGTGVPMARPGRWFEPVLARAILRDIRASARTGDVGRLDADLFCDCQDFEALEVTIGPVAVARGRARASVILHNCDQPTLDYTLVWTRAGWRVFDIESPDGGSVREGFLSGG